jgi:hypothetical protein
MATFKFKTNNQANESVSKFKLLSAYGGPGSIVHTQYGSVIISCIEEWGFLKKVITFHNEACKDTDFNADGESILKYVKKQSLLGRNGSIKLSNDKRFLEKFRDRKNLENLKYFVLVPDLELNELSNKIKRDAHNLIDYEGLSIPSSFMPKVFSDKQGDYGVYNDWYQKWIQDNEEDPHANKFFPPKIKKTSRNDKPYYEELVQDNIILICEEGHISDFPWSQFLRWRNEEPAGIFDQTPVDLFNYQKCCNNPKIIIKSATSNASGFDGKRLKCDNKGCPSKGKSLKGLFNVLIKCHGHKPWEADTGDAQYYSGIKKVREGDSQSENCTSSYEEGKKKGQLKPMSVALTTANNLYYSRIMSSIYMPNELFKSDIELKREKLQADLKKYMDSLISEEDKDLIDIYETKCKSINHELNSLIDEVVEFSDLEKEIHFRYQEYSALNDKSPEEINLNKEHLKVADVTDKISSNELLNEIFNKVIRVDNMKITSAQLDFSRVHPVDGDSEIKPKNIFRSRPENVLVYPVVENYGEGIFFSFNHDNLNKYKEIFKENLDNWTSKLKTANQGDFSKPFVDYSKEGGWQLYLVHTFAHLIMRELEFRCGYPTASLKERIYVSNDKRFEMYGCLIYTAEGAEGSMGGLIAQTKGENLVNLIKSAMKRATICHSDPLCWESDGQGLFDLNFAGCFSCALVSETSCEHRNLYLDRKILVDSEFGFFKELL